MLFRGSTVTLPLPAFVDPKLSLGRVRMYISTYIFPARVADGFLGGKVFARTKIKAAFISVQTAFFGDVVRDDYSHQLICMSGTGDANTPSAIGQTNDRTLVRWSG